LIDETFLFNKKLPEFPLSFRIVFEESILVVDFLAKFPKIGPQKIQQT